MKDFLDKAARMALLWRMAILKFILISVQALAIGWLTALNKLDWSALEWDDQRNILIGLAAYWTTNMIAFMDKSAAQLSSGHVPGFDVDVDTTLIKKPQP